jgi:hypothetical protein
MTCSLRARITLLIAACVLVAACQYHHPGVVDGHAFATVVEQGGAAPLHERESMVVALIELHNTGGRSVTLLGARPVWASDPSALSHLMVTPAGSGSAGMAVGLRERGGTPMPGAAVPPASDPDDAALFSFEVRLPTSGGSTLIVGWDISYELDGRQHVQRAPVTVLICPWGPNKTPPPCETFRGLRVSHARFTDLLRTVQQLDRT